MSFIRRHGPALGLAMLLTIGAVSISPPRFRIFADETNLMNMAFAMYDQRSFSQPYGMFEEESFQTLTRAWGKRPLFYPFVVSLAHTFLGYSADNGFVVNAVSGFLCLFLMYFILQRWFTRFHGVVGMMLLASFPLYVLCMTSGGYEILNMLFLLLVFLVLDSFLVSRQSHDVELLCLSLVLLAQIRYESILLTLCLIPLALCYVRKPQINDLTFRSVLVPLTYLPILWQRMTHLHAITLMPVPGDPVPRGQGAFSIHALLRNLDHNLDFFLGTESRFGMIPMLLFASLAGLAYGLYRLFRRGRTGDARIIGLCIAGALTLMGHVLIIFSYYYGDLTRYIAMRLGIVFIPFIVCAAVLLLEAMPMKRHFWRACLSVGCAALIVFYWPIAGKNEATGWTPESREYRMALSFLNESYGNANVLVFAAFPGNYIIHRRGAVTFGYANVNHAYLLRQLREHRIRDIIAIQQIRYSDHLPREITELKPVYKLAHLFEAKLSSRWYVRLSKVML